MQGSHRLMKPLQHGGAHAAGSTHDVMHAATSDRCHELPLRRDVMAPPCVIAQCGPSHDDQPVFVWSDVKVKRGELPLHVGHPDIWGFGWVQMWQNGTLSPIDSLAD
jgi:hypothetical protein